VISNRSSVLALSARSPSAVVTSLPPPPDSRGGHPEEFLVVPRWGLADAGIAYVLALFCSILLSFMVADPKSLTIYESVFLSIPLWIFSIGFPLWATRTKGNGPRIDLGLEIRWIDVLIGLLGGAVAQVVLPIIYGLFVSESTLNKLDDPARELVGSAPSVAGKVLLVVTTVLVAPFAEELFYRGLVGRSFERMMPRWIAMAITAAIFGAVHFQPLQFAGLFGFGLILGTMALLTRRLGAPMVAHVAFNAVAMWSLLH